MTMIMKKELTEGYIRHLARQAAGAGCPPQMDLAMLAQKDLPPERTKALRAHISRCPRCASALEGLELLAAVEPRRPSRAAERRLEAIFRAGGSDLVISPKDSWTRTLSRWISPVPQVQPALRGAGRVARDEFRLNRGGKARLAVTCSGGRALLELAPQRGAGVKIPGATLHRDGRPVGRLVPRQGRIMITLDRPGRYLLAWGRSGRININMV